MQGEGSALGLVVLTEVVGLDCQPEKTLPSSATWLSLASYARATDRTEGSCTEKEARWALWYLRKLWGLIVTLGPPRLAAA